MWSIRPRATEGEGTARVLQKKKKKKNLYFILMRGAIFGRVKQKLFCAAKNHHYFKSCNYHCFNTCKVLVFFLYGLFLLMFSLSKRIKSCYSNTYHLPESYSKMGEGEEYVFVQLTTRLPILVSISCLNDFPLGALKAQNHVFEMFPSILKSAVLPTSHP